jgi:TPR repeat protein
MSDDLIRWLQHADVVEEEQRDYLFAAAKSDASAAFELGVAMLSERAYGIKKDVPNAIQYLTKAAKDMGYAPVTRTVVSRV